ncbi:amino acid permease [Amycolatopsis sp. WGS_07]|uniref:amino acid permease n=1 Tax=Amycolatopsis sp. WGS_07 TaxID=3076764 RepID=UPI003872C97F
MADTPRSGQKLLLRRHVTMIAIGGVIGATLFVGTGTTVLSTGPAVIVSYAIGGLYLVLCMRMLGEMAARKPARGSFSTYAKDAFGPWAGFLVGWLYWLVFVILIAYEASLLGFFARQWLPGVPIWAAALVLLGAMTATNLFSIRLYGNAEYWIALVKVLAIIAFLVVGVLLVTGVLPAATGNPGLGNLFRHGGFAPLGWTAVLSSVVFVVFSMGGTEIAAIAASESDDPQRNVLRAIRSVLLRVLLFYVGSVAIIAAVIPWDDQTRLASPYASVFGVAGLGGAERVMSVVIFLSVLSVMNSAIYTSSRMLTALADRGEAPAFVTKENRFGTPVVAVLVCAATGAGFTMINLSSLESLFTFLATCTGGVLLIVYGFIAAAQVRLRKRHGDDGLAARMWLFPWLSYLFIAASVVLYAAQAFLPGLRLQFFCTSGLTLVALAAYGVKRVANRSRVPEPVPAAESTARRSS